MREWRSLLPIIVFTALYAVVSLSVTNSYYQLVMTLVPVWAIFGLSWNLLSGYTGLISFGHAAFFGVGAYAVVLGQIHFDLSPWIMIPDSATSSRPVSRSRTMRAPWPSVDRSAAARATSSATWSTARESAG